MEGFVLLALQTEHEAMSRGTQAVSPDAGESRETAAPPYGPQEVRPPAASCPSWASDLRNREVIHLYRFSSRICGDLNSSVGNTCIPFPLPSSLPPSFLFSFSSSLRLSSYPVSSPPFPSSPLLPFFSHPLSFPFFLPSLPPSSIYENSTYSVFLNVEQDGSV